MTSIPIQLNATRSGLEGLPEPRRRERAARAVRMFVLPRHPQFGMLDTMVPDVLITEDMVERFLELEPPLASVVPDFQVIIDEIEYCYVVGVFFAAVSASCVTIERMLNMARIELHPHHQTIKRLWRKGASNEWHYNIDALATWGYLDEAFAAELKEIYRLIRCRYLHSQPVGDAPQDALRSTRAAYRILSIFLGFPGDLFQRGPVGFECKNDADPRYQAFYLPRLSTGPAPSGSAA